MTDTRRRPRQPARGFRNGMDVVVGLACHRAARRLHVTYGQQTRRRGPAVERLDDGDWWIIGGQQTFSYSGPSSAGWRFDGDIDGLNRECGSKTGLGGYIPEMHLKENETDGISGCVLYPGITMCVYPFVPDSDAATDALPAYNDWIIEFVTRRRTDSRLSLCSTSTTLPARSPRCGAVPSRAWSAAPSAVAARRPPLRRVGARAVVGGGRGDEPAVVPPYGDLWEPH